MSIAFGFIISSNPVSISYSIDKQFFLIPGSVNSVDYTNDGVFVVHIQRLLFYSLHFTFLFLFLAILFSLFACFRYFCLLWRKRERKREGEGQREGQREERKRDISFSYLSPCPSLTRVSSFFRSFRVLSHQSVVIESAFVQFHVGALEMHRNNLNSWAISQLIAHDQQQIGQKIGCCERPNSSVNRTFTNRFLFVCFNSIKTRPRWTQRMKSEAQTKWTKIHFSKWGAIWLHRNWCSMCTSQLRKGRGNYLLGICYISLSAAELCLWHTL